MIGLSLRRSLRLVGKRSFAAVPQSTKAYDLLKHFDETRSFRELLRSVSGQYNAKHLLKEADAVATGMHELGADKGSRVLVCADGGQEQALLLLVASKLGCTLCFVDQNSSQEDLAKKIRLFGPQMIFLNPGKDFAVAQIFADLFPDVFAAQKQRCIIPSAEFPTVETIIHSSERYLPGMARCSDLKVYGKQALYYKPESAKVDSPYIVDVSENGNEVYSEEYILDEARALASSLNIQGSDRVLTLSSGKYRYTLPFLASLSVGALAIVPGSPLGNNDITASLLTDPTIVLGNTASLASVAGKLPPTARQVDVSPLQITVAGYEDKQKKLTPPSGA